MNLLHPQNAIFRLLQIECRPEGTDVWKRIRGDEIMLHTLQIGRKYHLRVLNPDLTVSLGGEGKPFLTPENLLPLHD